MSKKIKIILLDNVKWLWHKWDVVEVSVPYAQNVLINKKIWKIADNNTLNELKQKQESIKKHHDDQIKIYKDIIGQINNKWWLKMLRQTTAMNHLYDKIDEKDISKEILNTYKVKIPDKNIKIQKIIDTIWEYNVEFNFEDININFSVLIVKK